MSPAQHTPGWLPPLDPYKGSGRTLTINGVPALLVKRVLAESDRFCPVTLAQADVFARLFAAAPELLAALEAATQDVALASETARARGLNGVADELSSHAVIYRAAIAKAKGGAS